QKALRLGAAERTQTGQLGECANQETSARSRRSWFDDTASSQNSSIRLSMHKQHTSCPGIRTTKRSFPQPHRVTEPRLALRKTPGPGQEGLRNGLAPPPTPPAGHTHGGSMKDSCRAPCLRGPG